MKDKINTTSTGIKIKCCVCSQLKGNLHSDHLNDKIIKEVADKGYHDDNSYVCEDCDC